MGPNGGSDKPRLVDPVGDGGIIEVGGVWGGANGGPYRVWGG